MGLRQDVYEAVYDALTSANLLSSTATVTAAFIDRAEAFPQVVVHPVDVDKSNYTYDRTYNTKDIRVSIDVWTKKNKEKDEIADEIDSVLINSPVSGVTQTGWSESNALESPGGNKLHLKTITINYMKG